MTELTMTIGVIARSEATKRSGRWRLLRYARNDGVRNDYFVPRPMLRVITSFMISLVPP